MATPLLARCGRFAALGIAVVALMACGASTTVASVATATPTAMATPTMTPIPATPTLAPGVCNAADFPTKTSGGPQYASGTPNLQYPPLTYYYEQSPGMGNHPYALCSSGTPATILAFMTQSLTAAGWKITSSSATILAAEIPTNPPSGFCYTVNMMVGASASYPGEWAANFHPPATPCS